MAAGPGGTNQIEGDEPAGLVTLGRITGAHGVRGWVKLHSETQPKKNILQYGPWMLRLKTGWQRFELESGRLQGKTVAAKLVGCDDRDMAEGLKGALIAVYRGQLPEVDKPGEFYWADLEGIRVETTEGESLGNVSHLIATGSNDVLVVKGERERLIPYIWEQVVKEVDLDKKEMIVDWDSTF